MSSQIDLGIAATPQRAWTPQQRAVFEHAAGAPGHLVVQAYAGAGKTTTTVEACARLPPGSRALLVAFNKSIAEELAARAPRGAEVCTLHALGFRALRGAWGRVAVDRQRGRTILRRLGVRGAALREVGDFVALCKARLQVDPAKIASAPQALEAATAAGLKTTAELAEVVVRAMAASLEPSPEVSFDDMVFAPAAAGWSTGAYTHVFVDETQDMSRAQLALARAALAPGGRMVLVGDRNQAIYSWRGADVGAMDRMRRELGAAELPLSVSYRCARAVVAVANEVVPGIEAAPGAPAGVVRTCAAGDEDWAEGDFVLSRVNAPLVRHALAALRRGVRARIQGRDLGEGLAAWVRGLGAGSAADLVRRAHAWRAQQLAAMEALLAEGEELDEDAAREVEDRCATVEALADGCARSEDVVRRLQALFSDDGPGLVFSSTHRAKGLERERVWLLADTYRPSRSDEEQNLWYVAVTRARRELVFVVKGEVKDAIVAEACGSVW